MELLQFHFTLLLLEGRGREIWMASVHYHDRSSDQGSNDYSNLSLQS